MLDIPKGQEILEELGLKYYQEVDCCILSYQNKTLGVIEIIEGRAIYY